MAARQFSCYLMYVYMSFWGINPVHAGPCTCTVHFASQHSILLRYLPCILPASGARSLHISSCLTTANQLRKPATICPSAHPKQKSHKATYRNTRLVSPPHLLGILLRGHRNPPSPVARQARPGSPFPLPVDLAWGTRFAAHKKTPRAFLPPPCRA